MINGGAMSFQHKINIMVRPYLHLSKRSSGVCVPLTIGRCHIVVNTIPYMSSKGFNMKKTLVRQ